MLLWDPPGLPMGPGTKGPGTKGPWDQGPGTRDQGPWDQGPGTRDQAEPLTFLKWEQKKNYYNNNTIGRFPGGGLENQNPARTIAHSPPGVKQTLNYMLREKTNEKLFYIFGLCI